MSRVFNSFAKIRRSDSRLSNSVLKSPNNIDNSNSFVSNAGNNNSFLPVPNQKTKERIVTSHFGGVEQGVASRAQSEAQRGSAPGNHQHRSSNYSSNSFANRVRRGTTGLNDPENEDSEDSVDFTELDGEASTPEAPGERRRSVLNRF